MDFAGPRYFQHSAYGVVLVKQKPSSSPTHVPYSFPTSSHWKQPSLVMKDLALDFPVPHFLAAITRTSHPCSVELENEETAREERKAPLSECLSKLCTPHSLKPSGSCGKNSLWPRNQNCTRTKRGTHVLEGKNTLLLRARPCKPNYSNIIWG